MPARRRTLTMAALVTLGACGSPAPDTSSSGPTSSVTRPVSVIETGSPATPMTASSTTSPTVSTTAPPTSTTVSGPQPSDGHVRCTSAFGYSFLIPSGWFAAASFADPRSSTTTRSTALDDCSAVDHLGQGHAQLATARPGYFVATAYEYDAYDVALVPAHDASGRPTDSIADAAAAALTHDLLEPRTVHAGATSATIDPPQGVDARVVSNAAGLTGVRLEYAVERDTLMGGGPQPGARVVAIFVARPGASVLRIGRVHGPYAIEAPPFDAAIDQIFATLRLA